MDQSTYTDAPRGYAIVGFALGFSFSGDIVHRWEDGSGMVLRVSRLSFHRGALLDLTRETGSSSTSLVGYVDA